MQTLFNRVLVKQARVEPGDRVLVALSGGADSVVLLHLLLQAAKVLEIEVRAAHLDHGMRTESAGDVSFVQVFCLQHKVPSDRRPPGYSGVGVDSQAGLGRGCPG